MPYTTTHPAAYTYLFQSMPSELWIVKKLKYETIKNKKYISYILYTFWKKDILSVKKDMPISSFENPISLININYINLC